MELLSLNIYIKFQIFLKPVIVLTFLNTPLLSWAFLKNHLSEPFRKKYDI